MRWEVRWRSKSIKGAMRYRSEECCADNEALARAIAPRPAGEGWEVCDVVALLPLGVETKGEKT